MFAGTTIIILLCFGGLMGMYLAATWSIGLWLLGALIAFGAVDTLDRHWKKAPSTTLRHHLRAKIANRLGEVLGQLLLAFALVTVVQVLMNVWVWLFDNRGANDALSDWLLRNQEKVTSIRSRMVHLLRPRVTLSLIVVALLAGRVRPSWRLVQRYVGARKYVDRILQLTTVVVSVAFVTSEYAASYERAFAETRVTLIAKERAERETQKRRIAGAVWLRDVLQRSKPAERLLYAEFVHALPERSRLHDDVSVEADRFKRRWASFEAEGSGARSHSSSADVLPEPAVEGGAPAAHDSLWRDAADVIGGPGDVRPLHSDWELEHGLTKQVTARASEATHAAVEIAKLILGEANPEGLVELFVEAVQDAAADTFIPRWLEQRKARARANDNGAPPTGEQPFEAAAQGPSLPSTIEAEVGHPVGVALSPEQAVGLRLRLQAEAFEAGFKKTQFEAEVRPGVSEGESEPGFGETLESAHPRLTPLEVIAKAAPKVIEVLEHDVE